MSSTEIPTPEFLKYNLEAELEKIAHIAALDSLSDRAEALLWLMDQEGHHNFVLHSYRVATFAHDMALASGYSQQEAIILFYKGLLHDIGKIRTHNFVLDKPGKLDPAELVEMRRHAFDSQDILTQAGFPLDFALAGRNHHQTLDGNGYPAFANGELPDMDTLILTIADIHDAICDPNRRYQLPEPLNIAIEKMNSYFSSGRLEKTFQEIYNKLFARFPLYSELARGPSTPSFIANSLEIRGMDLLNSYRNVFDEIMAGV